MKKELTRREFISTGSASLALGLGASALPLLAAAADETVRCGFIGVGGRGTALLKAALRLANVQVTAVCEPDPDNLNRALDRIEDARGKRPNTVGYGPWSYRDLLASDQLDCVVIATPCDWHSTMYRDALEAGKPFYGEKPLAITSDGVALVKAAREKHPDAVAQIGCQWSSNKARAEMVERARAGEIGDLVEGRFHRYNGWASLGNWFNQRERSGDWMLEQAVHEFNLMCWVTGKLPVAAYAAGRPNVTEPENAERDVTDFYSAILEYEDGLIVHYAHGWINPPGFTGLQARFVGTKGGLDVMGATIRVRGEKEDRTSKQPGGDTREHLANFIDAVRAGDPAAVNCDIEQG
ncbi:MAG TPA: Gfo/Idh/MocA family oxidoreductase, partial [Armatimonadota bacterium]|nr:Gfo/Idh/MocA family oxidoreductase [Armatimonadota bacterium]